MMNEKVGSTLAPRQQTSFDVTRETFALARELAMRVRATIDELAGSMPEDFNVQKAREARGGLFEDVQVDAERTLDELGCAHRAIDRLRSVLP